MEVTTLEFIMNGNEQRWANSREWVGGLYFVVSVGLAAFLTPIALVAAYVLPLRRFASIVALLESVKIAFAIYYFAFLAIFFIVTGASGLIGIVAVGGLLVLVGLVLIIVAVIRRIMHKRTGRIAAAKARKEEAHDAASPPPAEPEVNASTLNQSEDLSKIPSGSEPEQMAQQNGAVTFNASNAFEVTPPPSSRQRVSSGAVSPATVSPAAAAISPRLGGNVSFVVGDPKDLGRSTSMALEESNGDYFSKNLRGSLALSTSISMDDSPPLSSRPSSNKRGSITGLPPRRLVRRSTTTGVTAGTGLFGLRRRIRRFDEWTACPEAMAIGQIKTIVASLLVVALVLGLVFLLQAVWFVPTYQLTVHNDVTAEFQPQLTAQALQFMYAFPGLATSWQLNTYAQLFTEYCGSTYKKSLSAIDKRTQLYDAWVFKYAINMSMFIPSDWRQYNSVNDWFIRPIDMSLRPPPNDDTAIVSPADCRMVIYENRPDVRIWLKNVDLSYQTLIGNLQIEGSAHYFENGAMIVARLAPQDYHRFHSPVAGTIVAIKDIQGTYWSVSADAVRSDNAAFYNRRKVVVVDGGAQIGRIALIVIGATCVGSVVLEGTSGQALRVGQYVDRGEQLGNFQFGGSTMVVLIPQGRATFDSTLLYRSRFPVETLVQVNDPIGWVR